MLGAVCEQSSSVCCAASDHRGSGFPLPSPDSLSSRFSFLALLSPFCCGFLLSWEPQDHSSAGGMCCSAQLLGADRVGGGVVLLFFLTKGKYKSFFLCESAKFLPGAAALGPPSLHYLLFILWCGFPFCQSSSQRWRGAALSGENNFSPWTPPPSPGIQVSLLGGSCRQGLCCSLLSSGMTCWVS